MRDRLFAACGVASVALVLVGSMVGSAGGQPSYTLDSSSAHIAHELATPVGALGWAGAYLETGRRALGWSAIGIAAVTLVATPALVEHGGQIGYFLWLVWIVVASVGLARDPVRRSAAATRARPGRRARTA